MYRVLNHFFKQNAMKPLGRGDKMKLGSSGKPYLLREDGTLYPYFNLSYRLDSVIIACTINKIIGVDLENTRLTMKFSSMEAIMEYYYLPSERDYVLNETKVREKRFLALWARKEAAIKAIGVSIISHGQLVNSLADIWIDEENGGKVVGGDLIIPRHEYLLASIAVHDLASYAPVQVKILDATFLFHS